MNADVLIAVLQAIEKKLAHQQNVVVSVCGGSCTRKSSLVSAFLSNHFKDRCVVISQDQFQLQPTFLNKVNPKYMWDHPGNFGIEQCQVALTQLRQNITVKIPDYQFKKEQKVGFKVITPKPILIFEGLYANFNELAALNDVSIYVESPCYARMIRRIFRNTLDRYKHKEHELILKSFCNSVAAAHQDFVIDQKHKCDYIIQVPLAFDQITGYYALEPVDYDTGKALTEYNLVHDQDIKVRLLTDHNDQSRFILFYKERPYLNFQISNTLATKTKTIDWLAY
ncbi:MAG: hypothetical protein AAGF77_14185 [Bacteroidota bacterium]|nr:hypothetical protein [uncultured Allomuricauda sp.]